MQAQGKVGFLKQLKHYLKRPLLRQDLMAGVTYLLPSAVVLLAFVIVPVVMALVLSFSKWELLSVEGRKFIGLGNYTFLLTNKEFWNTIKNTIYFGAVKIPADIILSLLVAMLLNGSIRGLSFYRTIYFLPVITSTVAVSAVWRYMYDPNFGFANVVLKWL
ncbi:MAG: sugar ABC transporter permease, partial [Anaerolineae bacterium]|nr:sugar ABC transporter permease [Anaerolineae bacterium]